VHSLHKNDPMPTLKRLSNKSIRVNVPDHPPPHVHIVMADRRDALVFLDTLEIISSSVRKSEILDALEWIAVNRDLARSVFEECNT